MNEYFGHLNDISALDISQPFLCIFRMWIFASLLSLDSPIASWQSTPSETPDFLLENLALHLGMYFCRIGITRACSSHSMAQSRILAGDSALKTHLFTCPWSPIVHHTNSFQVALSKKNRSVWVLCQSHRQSSSWMVHAAGVYPSLAVSLPTEMTAGPRVGMF